LDKSPELLSIASSPYGKFGTKIMAASCGFSLHGSSDEYTTCTRTEQCCYGGPVQVRNAQSQCGGACTGGTANCARHPSFGTPCTGEPNACGEIVSGRYDRCGICVSTTAAPRTCTVTNVCGQTFTGYQCPSGCTAGNGSTNINNTCIQNFTFSADSVDLNGFVDFAWKVITRPNQGARCDFVDLTTPTPRPIPGLQNLDPTVDKARITNIQSTTRFCLICQFYNLTTNESLGEAVAHQWIRIIQVGEN
jgi:hypothetical protein